MELNRCFFVATNEISNDRPDTNEARTSSFVLVKSNFAGSLCAHAATICSNYWLNGWATSRMMLLLVVEVASRGGGRRSLDRPMRCAV